MTEVTDFIRKLRETQQHLQELAEMAAEIVPERAVRLRWMVEQLATLDESVAPQAGVWAQNTSDSSPTMAQRDSFLHLDRIT
jgi:hypothetical protein